MTKHEEIAKRLVEAVMHTMNGCGPSSVRLIGKDGPQSGCVVFVMPGEIGVVIDDALDALYAQLGWRVQREGHGEVN